MNNLIKTKLAEVADVKLSNVDKKFHSNEIKVRLCNYTDVYKNAFIDSRKAKFFMLASCNQNEYDNFRLIEGQVAITKDSETRDDIGVSTYISESFDDVVLGYHTSLITPNKKFLNGKYLHYWLNTKQSKNYFENNAGGSGQRCTLPIDIIKALPLQLPTIEMQDKIASLLFNIDTKTELNNQIISNLEAFSKFIFDYWFVQYDFPNKNGDPYKRSGGKMLWNKELKREIPEGWEVKSVKDLMLRYSDKSNHIESKLILNSGKYPVITQDNGDFIAGYTNEENPIEDIPLLIFGDHSCTIRYIDFPFFRGADGTQILRFSNELVLYMLLYLQKIIPQITGYGKYERHFKYLKEFRVVVPPSQNLNDFFSLIKPMYDKINKSRFESQLCASYRDWLLPMLMNGQVISNI